MAKKKEIVEEVITPSEPVKVTVQPLTSDLGRDDLNLLRDKINELIAFNS